MTDPRWNALQEEILLIGLEDWVGLWLIAGVAKELRPQAAPSAVISHSLTALEPLLHSDLLEAGSVTLDGFKAWDADPRETMDRITRDWTLLGRDPNPGEVVWFKLTPAGEVEARHLLSEKPHRRVGLPLED